LEPLDPKRHGDAIRDMRNDPADLRELMSRFSESDRELAWSEIEQQLRHFEVPKGFESERGSDRGRNEAGGRVLYRVHETVGLVLNFGLLGP
jgi:hypothetical protein